MQAVFQRLRQREAAPPWSVLSAMLFIVTYGVIWIAAQAMSVTLTNDDLTAPSPTALVFGVLIVSALSALVVVQWVRRRQPDTWPRALHLETSHTLPLFVCLLLGLAAAWGIDLIGVLLHLKGGQIVPPPLIILTDQNAPAFGWIVAAITAIIVEPLAETLIFCGLVYPALAVRVGNLASIVLTSLLYTGLMAVLAGPLPWYGLIQPLLMCLAVTALRAHTQSTQMAAVARGMFGLFFVLSALISARF